MADTFVKIATVTVGSGGTASMAFSSIPSTYTDLCIKISGRTNIVSTDDYALVRFNADSGSNYPYKQLLGSGAAASSNGGTLTGAAAVRVDGSTATASTFGSSDVYIPNYAGSSYKSVSGDGVSENNATSAASSLWAALWNNTAAITSIDIVPGGGTLFVQYSTATLYGISKT
jgi:hypothetical protein